MKRKRILSLSLTAFLLTGFAPVAAEESAEEETIQAEQPDEEEQPAEAEVTDTEEAEIIAGDLPEITEEAEEAETAEEITDEITEETVPEEEILNTDTDLPEIIIEEEIAEDAAAEEESLAAAVTVFLVLDKAKAYIDSQEVSVDEIEAGKEITLTADKPSTGYRFKGWKFTDADNKEVSKSSLNIISEKDLSITFEVPEQPLKITALYELSGAWKKDSKGWWYEWNGSYLKSTWKQIGGKWYYFGSDGYMKIGWLKSGGKWYWLGADGAMITGWQEIKGKKYYFDKEGAMRTGWLKSGGKWYYLNADGDMAVGWKRVKDKWYWMNREGVMVTGWQKIGGEWYFMLESGAMASGWKQLDGKWYFLDRTSGVMRVGWLKDGNKWYYLGADGVMFPGGWKKIENKWYWFTSSGAMATGWLHYKNAWYWLDSSGKMVSDQIIVIGGKAYHFEADGIMTTGWKTYGTMRFHFDETNGWVTEMYHNGVPYYSQRDGRWGDVKYGDYNPIKNTGCAPTSGTMIVNYLKGTNYTPADIAALFYQWGDYNSNYGHGTGSTAWRKFSRHFGLTFQNSIKYSDMVAALKAGKVMIITVGYDGKYVVGNYTHTMCFYGYDSAGRTYVHDPFNEANNGWIDAKSLYNRATSLWLDNVDGGPLYAFSK